MQSRKKFWILTSLIFMLFLGCFFFEIFPNYVYVCNGCTNFFQHMTGVSILNEISYGNYFGGIGMISVFLVLQFTNYYFVRGDLGGKNNS